MQNIQNCNLRSSQVEQHPEEWFLASEAAKYLGICRQRIYIYFNSVHHSLKHWVNPANNRCYVKGQDLIDYKAAGLPKRGRKRKSLATA